MEYCDICGKGYEIVYLVPDKVWNKITPKKGEAGCLCIECADKRAQNIGIVLYWSANEKIYCWAKEGINGEIENLKKTALDISKQYKNNIKIEINVDKEKGDVKVTIAAYDL